MAYLSDVIESETAGLHKLLAVTVERLGELDCGSSGLLLYTLDANSRPEN